MANKIFDKINSNIKIYKKELNEQGAAYLITARLNKILNPLSFYNYKLLKSSNTFQLNKRIYKYFFNRYNFTWRNERAIEIPIILGYLGRDKGEVLEIGNVLSHYIPVNHDIVDKYEKDINVINKDAETFKSKKKYKLIISISTIEHIGWDGKEKKDKLKIERVIKNLKSLLARNGTIIFTSPVGYNPFLDNIIKKNKIKYSAVYYCKRISRDNKWIQTTADEVKDTKYNSPFPHANAIYLILIKK